MSDSRLKHHKGCPALQRKPVCTCGGNRDPKSIISVCEIREGIGLCDSCGQPKYPQNYEGYGHMICLDCELGITTLQVNQHNYQEQLTTANTLLERAKEENLELHSWIKILLFSTMWEGGDLNADRLCFYKKKWLKEFEPTLQQSHYGDCVKVPMACVRCQSEDVITGFEIIQAAITQHLDGK